MESDAEKTRHKFLTIFSRNTIGFKMHYCHVDSGKRTGLIPKVFSMTMTRLKDITGYRTVSHDGFLYFIGGREIEGGALRKYVLRFDARTNTWSHGAAMRTPRIRHTATVVQGLIYVIGGEGKGGRILSSVEMYDPVYDLWADTVRLPLPAADHATCLLNNTLYVSGGCTDINRSLSDSFWKLHIPGDDFWSDVVYSDENVETSNNLPAVRERHTMIGHINRIYCFGGVTVQGTGKSRRAVVDASVNVFNLDVPGWTVAAGTTRNPRCSAGAVLLGHDIIMVGGQKLHGTGIQTVECYNTRKKTWTELFNLSENDFSDVDCCILDVPTTNKEFNTLGLVMKSNWIMW